ncbi:hypothetical protein McanCB49686_000392 [Microsporum canis]
MCHPSAKSTVAKATADSPASTDVTSPSLTEPASLDTASSPSHKSSSPIPSTERQGKKALTRFDKIMEDMKKKSPEEITAFIQKYGPKMITPTLFQFAELNGIHRACFSRDGTIIDSSARKILEVKDEKPISGYKGHWNLDKSSNNLTLLFKASKSSKFTAFQPLQSYVKAMHNCILQLCDQESFLCLFRYPTPLQRNDHMEAMPTSYLMERASTKQDIK